MAKKIYTAVLALLSAAVISWAAGKHEGEVKQLDVRVEFHSAFGTTVADAQGTHYHVGNSVSHEDKVYASSIWGEYPLYFFGTTVGAKVTVTNSGPRAKAKLRIRSEAHYLRIDGSNGKELAPAKEIEVEVAKGETKEIDASFFVPWTEDAESGLDVLTLKVLHANEGEGSGNDPGLILAKRAIFCPPKFRPQ